MCRKGCCELTKTQEMVGYVMSITMGSCHQDNHMRIVVGYIIYASIFEFSPLKSSKYLVEKVDSNPTAFIAPPLSHSLYLV